MMEVQWTYRARMRLQQIHQKIAEDQPLNADRFIDKLIERGDRLSENAFRGRRVPEFNDPAIREVFEGSYRIIYQVQGNDVYILTVRAFAELLPEDFADA